MNRMPNFNEPLELERIQKRVYSLNLFTLKFANRKCINLLDVENLAGFTHLIVELPDLLWKSLLVFLLRLLNLLAQLRLLYLLLLV